MQDCLFCKIIKKEIPAEIAYEDEQVLVFKDINPMAPVHLIIIPKKHIPALADMDEKDTFLMGQIQLTAARLAVKMGLAEEGFRLVNNCGRDAQQTVMHIHYHLLAGRPLNWPPG
ncbi:HIT-like protein [Pelotomaculum schinkii]|uniref:HIT-like protein n=1 Tax=Pelotomaculum schinkii TaxID=78350 RepID=A0A4Y7REL4_9FIRM|nr:MULTISPECIES: histidine triad nucleotide-binding protein [Pelotomaculum]TEB07223.1 HIT-like protein [Pelotomaculum schinkii]TEB15371.1 HIT-like protein [Pelotomaculum sp. FP]